MAKLIQGKNDLATLRSDLAAQWDYEKNDYGPENYTSHSGMRVYWKCGTCGQSWIATINDRSNGRGCPFCAGDRPIPGKTDLAALRPDLVAQWDYENNDRYPECFTLHSGTRVFWKCQVCGQSWIATINDRSKNHNCPYCSRKKPILGRTDLATLRPDLAAQWDYDKNDLGPENYTLFSRKRVFWKCPTCNQSWAAKISDRSNGNGCPFCAGDCPIPGKTDLATLRPDLAAQWDYEKNDRGPENYTLFSNQRVFWKCPTCNQSWAATINGRSRNCNCPYCSRKKPIPGRTDLATLRPDLAAQWDYDKNDLGPENYTLFSRKRVFWKCPTCNQSWAAKISNRSNGTGCPFCAGDRPVSGKTDLATLRPHLVAEWDYGKNDLEPENYTLFSSKRVFWKCLTCNQSWIAKIQDRSNGTGCPFCAGRKKVNYDPSV